MPAKEFFEAGLVDENIYRFEIVNMEVREYKKRDPKPGESPTFEKMVGSFELKESADGTYELAPGKNPQKITESFPLYGKALRRLASLYRAVTGTAPTILVDEDTGEEIIDFQAMAAELRNGLAWGVVLKKNRQEKNAEGVYEDTDEVDSKFGWSFASSPDQVRPPKELAERLEREAAAAAEVEAEA
jgi:hypothetical protein